MISTEYLWIQSNLRGFLQTTAPKTQVDMHVLKKNEHKTKMVKKHVDSECTHKLWMKSMVSEDTRKIIALVIVTLSYISIPVLLLILAVTIYINVQHAIQFYYTRSATDGLVTMLLAFFNIGLTLVILALIRWIRK